MHFEKLRGANPSLHPRSAVKEVLGTIGSTSLPHLITSCYFTNPYIQVICHSGYPETA